MMIVRNVNMDKEASRDYQVAKNQHQAFEVIHCAPPATFTQLAFKTRQD